MASKRVWPNIAHHNEDPEAPAQDIALGHGTRWPSPGPPMENRAVPCASPWEPDRFGQIVWARIPSTLPGMDVPRPSQAFEQHRPISPHHVGPYLDAMPPNAPKAFGVAGVTSLATTSRRRAIWRRRSRPASFGVPLLRKMTLARWHPDSLRLLPRRRWIADACGGARWHRARGIHWSRRCADKRPFPLPLRNLGVVSISERSFSPPTPLTNSGLPATKDQELGRASRS